MLVLKGFDPAGLLQSPKMPEYKKRKTRKKKKNIYIYIEKNGWAPKNARKTTKEKKEMVIFGLSLHFSSFVYFAGQTRWGMFFSYFLRVPQKECGKRSSMTFFVFGTLSVTFRSLFLMLLSLFSSLFCQTPFAGLLLRQGDFRGMATLGSVARLFKGTSTNNIFYNSENSRRLWLFVGCVRVFQRPLTLILLKKYRNINGRRIVIQFGVVYTTFCQEEGHTFAKVSR